LIDGFKYWKKEDLATNTQNDSEESDVRSSDRYLKQGNQTSSANRTMKNRIISSPVKEDRLNNTRSNPSLLGNSRNMYKFNHSRIVSQTCMTIQESMGADDFIDDTHNDSVAFTNDSPDHKP
jgi:hypothetical protein